LTQWAEDVLHTQLRIALLAINASSACWQSPIRHPAGRQFAVHGQVSLHQTCFVRPAVDRKAVGLL
jgi:hypothetical protein